MRERITARRALWALLLAGALAAAACGGGGSESRSGAGMETGGEGMHGGEGGQHAGGGSDGTRVVLRLIAFQPDELEVSAGTEVTWVNEDDTAHTVTSGAAETAGTGSIDVKPDGKFDSGQLEKGEDFSFTFEEPGIYPYFCKLHPGTMRGRVTVR